MESNAYLFEVFASLVFGWLGVRLLRLGGRTGERPEKLLGAYFLLAGASYLAYEIPNALGLDAVYMAFAWSGRLLYDMAMLPWLLFLRRVFHPHARWARWLVWACAGLVVVALLGSTASGDPEGVAVDTVWFWLDWVGYTLPFAWVAVSAGVAHHQALRRQRIGLLEPVVANRYLLWSLFGAIQVSVSFALIEMYRAYEQQGFYTAWSDALVGVLEIASLMVLWLVFFAPAAYRRWLAAQGATPSDVGAA